MAYSTKIKVSSNSKKSKRRVTSSKRRNFASKKWSKGSKSSSSRRRRGSKGKRSIMQRLKSKRVRKALLSLGAIFLILITVGLIFALAYIQGITEDLPSRDKPFGNKSAASVIYDRNGKELYRVFGDENRDPVNIEEVPQLLTWAFLAAEDIDFYSHPGVDATAILRCSIDYVRVGDSSCGGSTITQQLIKLTALTNERVLERKIKEVILALQIERERDKDEILEMYLTIAPEGSNIYGITTAAKVYFDKELEELNLAEMAVLAAIPQNPTQLSPTKSANPEQAQQLVKQRQEYVLDQMERYKDLINEKAKEKNENDEDILTQEMIDEAREYELVYATPRFDIKAPHFVFYVQKLLQQRGYNGGEPFEMSDIETGGYKITTTLDLDYQEIAEEQVKKGVNDYGSSFGGENAALVALTPKNGEIVAMVGSKDYFAEPSPAGCTLGVSCKFEPNVNITDTLQSFGSSMKPMVYYYAMEQGLITPGSILPDIPIKIGNYEPKNYEGGFTGMNSARWHLRESRNIPAIYLVNQTGVPNFVQEMQKWGYSTLTNPQGYGPSISVGGADVKLIEHAQAYGVLANGGKLTQHEVILKIEDKDGNVIYEYEPASEQVADARGVYLVNHILNGKNSGPGDSWDGRDISGKTGTSEGQQETLFATYTPEIVAVGWLGNNNNEGMRYGASGFRTARPWVAEFVRRIGGSIPATPFTRPDGVISAGSCSADEGASCEGVGGSDLAIAGISVPKYVSVKTVTVCTDQPKKIARDIDIAVGKSETRTFKIFKMPDPNLQRFLDAWIESKPGVGAVAVPEEFCDINRNPGGSASAPWGVFISPTDGAVIDSGNLSVNFNAFSAEADVTSVELFFDGGLIDTITSLPHSGTYDIGTIADGNHTLSVKVYDSAGNEGTTSITLEKLGTTSIDSPSSGAALIGGTTNSVNFTYTGVQLNTIDLIVNGSSVGASCSASSCSWDTPATPGSYTLLVRGVRKGVTIDSNEVSVTVI